MTTSKSGYDFSNLIEGSPLKYHVDDGWPKTKRVLTLIVATILIFLATVAITGVLAYQLDTRFSVSGGYSVLVLVAVIAVVVWQHKRKSKIKQQKASANFMTFLNANNLTQIIPQDLNTGIPTQDQPLFMGINKTGTFTEVIALPSTDIPGYLYEYQYIIGSGKNRKLKIYTGAMFKIEKNLPHLVLDSRKNDQFSSNLDTYFEENQRIELEGEFNKIFDFYAPVGYSAEALDILSPDFMEKLMNLHSQFDVEINGQWVYIISADSIWKQQTMDELLYTTKKLVSDVVQKMRVYQMRPRSTFPELVGYKNEQAIRIGGKRISTAWIWATVSVLIIVYVAYLELSGSSVGIDTIELGFYGIGGLIAFFARKKFKN